MKKNIFRIVRIVMGILFLVIVGIICVYPFPNRNLLLQIQTDSTVYKIELNEEEIIKADDLSISLEGVSEITIQNIQFYGRLKSVSLKNLNFAELASYIDSVPEGQVTWAENGLIFSGKDPLTIIFNDEGKNVIESLAQSFLLERLCMMGVTFIIFLIVIVVSIAIEEKKDELNRDNHGPIYEIRKFGTDLKKYRTYMVYAAQTDLRAEVADSYLNRLWWLLEPFFNMLVYVIVFGRVMGNSIQNYATFVFSALLMWTFFNKTISYSVKLIRNNKDIVSKVYVPKFVLLLSNMILNLFKMLFSMIVLVIMLFIFKVKIGIEILWLIPIYVSLILLAFGVGMIFLHYGVYVDDLSYAVNILLSMLMLLSGVFYDVMATLSSPLNTFMLCLNPIAMLLDTMRGALLYQEIRNVPLITIWFFISVIFCCIGVHIVYKNENGYVKVV